MNKNLLENIILYLGERLGPGVEGKKKLMKLMFLINHFDTETKTLIPTSFLGTNFYIYYYGVFSSDVMKAISDLIKGDEVEDGFPLRIKRRADLDENTRHRVDKIIELFGNKSGYRLEVETLEMLGYDPSRKNEVFGEDVDILIKKRSGASRR